MKIDGRCHCGYITYEADIDPDKILICHCTDCQTLSGSAFRVVAYTQEDAFKLLSGELRTYIKISECGNKQPHVLPGMWNANLCHGRWGWTQGLLHSSGLHPSTRPNRPQWQVWSRSAQPWVTHNGSMRRFEKQPQIDQTGNVTLT